MASKPERGPVEADRKNPNPQGKGVVPVLRDWATMTPVGPIRKDAAVFLRDYCISSLVLAARFGFKPVPGKDYFLYAREGEWMLSLIGPHEWGQREPGAFLGRCRLRADMTWVIERCADEESDAVAVERAQAFVEGFVDTLAGQASVGENLPYYVSTLPYYQRLLATALATSLQRSLPDSAAGMKRLLHSARDWVLVDDAPKSLPGRPSGDDQHQIADAPAEFAQG